MRKALRVSIVIPVYNEAARLPACLEAIARQTVRPCEVIVVDNNSTDDSAAVARRYPFVRVVREPRQGVVHARDRGFNAARGEIIGRIDADTLVATDWIASLRRIFADTSVDAVTGKARYYGLAWTGLLNGIDLFFRRYFAWVLRDEVALQGANMALRRSVWRQVSSSVCRVPGQHEDFDLAIHINRHGYRVVFDESLVASLAYRQASATWQQFASYVMLSPQTYASHGLKSHRHMYPAVFLAMIGYLPLKYLHQGYDSQKGRFSLIVMLTAERETVRVNPATFVD